MAKNEKIKKVLEFDGEISGLLQSVNQIKNAFKNLDTTKLGASFMKDLDSVDKRLSEFQKKIKDPVSSSSQVDKLIDDYEKIIREIKELGETVGKLGSKENFVLLPKEEKDKLEKAANILTKIGEIEKKNSDLQKEKRAALTKEIAEKQKIVDAQKKSEKAAEQAIKDEELLKGEYKKQRDELKKILEYKEKLNDQSTQSKKDFVAKAEAQYRATYGQSENINQAAYDRLNKKAETHTEGYKKAKLTLNNSSLSQMEKELSKATKELQKFENAAASSYNKDIIKEWQDISAAAEALGINISEVTNKSDKYEIKIEKVKQALQGYITNTQNSTTQTDELKTEIKQISDVADQSEDKLKGLGNTLKNTFQKSDEIQNLTNQLKGFFTITSGAQMARRALSSAIGTIKELDASMTEMAVVTDATIGDYWERLPQYTSMAQKLGTSINDVLKAQTLYYQQGLDTNQVLALTEETLKMATIAGLDTAEATDRMTSALRGFNMEINETNAQRISDVYSELAAVTAADVNEISVAMSKTASIASSANMEFETTSALLSQIIETTREAPETAGTALKTIIARFQELKKDPSEIGEIDGEIVDANKIETALRSVGIALRDSEGQFRDLDDVFLELSSKWDGLSLNTQRYIATIAAGSRQQSRFIAMMSDYGRTMELVSAANNSAGKSQEQFDKTLESYEKKLQKIKTAWDAFLGGIVNSDIVKTGLDILNVIFGAINKIMEGLDVIGVGGVARIALLVGAFLGLKKVMSLIEKKWLKLGEEGVDTNGKVGVSAKTNSKIFESAWHKAIAAVRGDLKTLRAEAEAPIDINASNAPKVIDKDKTPDAPTGGAPKSKGKVASLFGKAKTSFMGKVAANAKGGSALKGIVVTLGKAVPYVAAILAAVAAIYKIGKAIYDNSPEQKLERLEEYTNQVKEAAEGAKEAYDSLSSSIENYDSIIEKMEDMTMGTTEYTQAIIEANEQAMALIELYPSLINALSTDSQGLMTIDKEALKEAQEEALKIQKTLQQHVLVTQVAQKDQINTAAQQDLNVFLNNLGFDRKTLLMQAQQGDIKEEDESYEEAQELLSEFTKLNKALTESENALKLQAKAALQSALALEGIEYEFGESAAELFAQIQNLDGTTIQNEMEKYIEKASTGRFWSWIGLDADTNDNEKLTKLFEDQGLSWMWDAGANAKSSSNFTAMKQLYDKLYGEGASKDLTAEDLVSKLTQYAYAEDFNNQFTDFVEKMQTTNKDNQELVNKFGSEGGKLLSTSEAFGKTTEELEESVRSIGKSLGLSDDLIEYLIKIFTKNQVKAQERVANRNTQLKNLEGNRDAFAGMDFYNTLTENVSDINIGGIIDKLQTILYRNSQDQATSFLKLLDSTYMTETLGLVGEDLNTFMTALNSIDITSVESWEALPEILEGLGIDMSGREQELKDFIATGKEAANAVEKIDLKKLNEEFKELYGVLNDIKKGKQLRGFSEDMKDKLVGMVEGIGDDLIYNIDTGTYTFVGPMEKLTDAINDNTAAQIGNGVEQLREKIAVAGWAEEFPKNHEGFDIDTANKFALSGILEELQRDYDLKKLDLSFGEGTDFGNFGEDTLKGWLEEVFVMASSKDAFENQLKESTKNLNISKYQSKDIAQNYFKSIEGNKDARTALLTQLGGTEEDLLRLDYLTRLIDQNDQAWKDLAKTLTDDAALRNQNKLIEESAKKVKDAVTEIKELEKLSKMKIFEDSKLDLSEQGELLRQQAIAIGDAFGIITTEQNYEAIMANAKGLYNPNTARLAYETLIGASANQYGFNINDLVGRTDLSVKETEAVEKLTQTGWARWTTEGMKLLTDIELAAHLVEQGFVEEWENKYNELYNLNEDINALIRERERLEKRYERTMAQSGATYKEVVKIQEAEINNLAKTFEKSKAIVQENINEMNKLISKNPELAKFITINGTTGEFDVDYKAIDESNMSADEYKELEKVVESLEKNRDAVVDQLKTQDDIYDTCKDIEDQNLDSYESLLDEVKENIVQIRQNEIDELSKINDSIQQANQELVDSIQKQIDATRQLRDNNKTEQDIADKQARLAYLRQDTSGANQMEILELERELAEQSQDYQDTLVDQAIQKLGEQNDEAAEQRQKQIEFAQLQLEAYEKSEQIWTDAKEILDKSLAEIKNGAIWSETSAGKLEVLANDDSKNPITAAKEAITKQESAIQAALVGGGDEKSNLKQKIEDYQKAFEDSTAEEGVFGLTKQAINNAIAATTQVGTNVKNEVGKNITIADLQGTIGEYGKDKGNAFNTIYPDATDPVTISGITAEESNAKLISELFPELDSLANQVTKDGYQRIYKTFSGDYVGEYGSQDVQGIIPTLNAIKAAIEDAREETDLHKYLTRMLSEVGADGFSKYNTSLIEEMIEFIITKYGLKNIELPKYATGGLADFTGPAWLDGTRSKPELVLNATDTANFIALKDILSDSLKNTSGTSKSSGDNIFEIEINVDEIKDDYDVEQIAQKIRSMLYEDASYRNVNAIQKRK